MSLFALRVDIAPQEADSNPVLDVFSTTAWDYFVSVNMHTQHWQSITENYN